MRPSAIPSVEKNIYFCFIGYAKAFDCVDHSKLWKIYSNKNYNIWDEKYTEWD